MILIVGGAYQGKLRTALSLIPDGRRQETEQTCKMGTEDLERLARENVADGLRDSLDDAMKKPVINRFHEYIRRFCREETERSDAESKMQVFLERLVLENPEAVIVCNELGCGIVPVEKTDRMWREMTGDACQFLAKRSRAVYRVVCGIPSVLKGGRI